MGWSFHLNEDGITFWKDGLIVLDCPLERIKKEPECALLAMKLLTELYQDDVLASEYPK